MTDDELGAAAREALSNRQYPEWIAEAFGASGMGVSGFVLFVMFIGAIGLFNWTESFTPPAVWLALVAPLLAVALPVPVVWRVMGIATLGFAMLFIGLYFYWDRI